MDLYNWKRVWKRTLYFFLVIVPMHKRWAHGASGFTYLPLSLCFQNIPQWLPYAQVGQDEALRPRITLEATEPRVQLSCQIPGADSSA